MKLRKVKSESPHHPSWLSKVLGRQKKNERKSLPSPLYPAELNGGLAALVGNYKEPYLRQNQSMTEEPTYDTSFPKPVSMIINA